MLALPVLRPGPLWDGINALLTAMSEIGLVAQAQDADAALRFLARQCVELVLIKLDAGDRRLLGPVIEMRALCRDTQVDASDGHVGLVGELVIDEGFSDRFLENLEQHLQPGKAALVLLMEHHWVNKASESMADLGGMVFQQTITDTLVEDLLEGKEAE